MKKELSKTYEPAQVEDKIYNKWEESGLFNSDNLDSKKDGYCIVMPPPNVTGVLHLGHAAMLALQDILIRYHRMNGEKTLWIPGTDHAAIATQTKVEKIIKEEGTSRHKLGREKFLNRVNEFAQNSHDTIVDQVKKMGSSCDWGREAYTLDEVRTKAVRSIFKLMYDDGLIYRGDRVVNWCPRCHSTLADDEVEYKEQKAKLYTFKYSKDFPITIATTRPETKLGDTAVAVNPKDDRYKEYIGKEFKVDFCGIPLKIKVIADWHIDMEFGTGALGVTPAHSMVDAEMATEHKLETVKVIDEDGKIRESFGEFSGLNVKEARKKIVEKIEELGLMEKEEEVDNKLSVCYRCDTPIEPLPSLQWFINVNKKLDKFKGKTIKEICIESVRVGVFGRDKINIYPERFEKNYFNWMENLNDWCISRQIWYGHRIPVWYKGDETYVGIDAPDGDGWNQDEDTLDTWFSSGLWTFSTLAKSPDDIRIENGKLVIDGEDFKNFHPTDVMETGYDILFFWVARMIIMTTYAVEDIPFKDVYLHGLVLDEKGKKMSKSKGNAIDPLEMNVKYGTDATRLALVIGSAPGNDMKLSEEKIAGFRNFSNKLWNISRFIIAGYEKSSDEAFELKTEADKWIFIKLKQVVAEVTNDLEKYNFSQAGEKLREFTWDYLADWYLEIAKFEDSKNKGDILYFILEEILKLWHPFIPFVTETIWENLGKEKMLMVETWPEKMTAGIKIDSDFDLTIDIIKAIRNARSENKVEPAKKVEAIIYGGKNTDFIKSQEILIKSLKTGISNLKIEEKGEEIKGEIKIVVGEIEIYLIGAIDFEKEKERLKKEVENLEKYIKTLKSKLDNKSFIENAPEQVVKTEKENLKNSENKLKEYLKSLDV